MKNRNWTPVKKGDIYCSPACGANCTYEKYIKAIKSAKKLKKRCELEIGGKWAINIHENLGWYWNVFHPKTNISISYHGSLLTDDYFTIGLFGATPVQISTHPQTFKTPKEAWEKQIEVIKNEFNKYKTILSNAQLDIPSDQ